MCESAMPVYAVMAGAENGYYSRRERQTTSGGRCPDGRSRPPDEGRVAAGTEGEKVAVTEATRTFRRAPQQQREETVER
jgi:hypothetical protein